MHTREIHLARANTGPFRGYLSMLQRRVDPALVAARIAHAESERQRKAAKRAASYERSQRGLPR